MVTTARDRRLEWEYTTRIAELLCNPRGPGSDDVYLLELMEFRRNHPSGQEPNTFRCRRG
ncbi:hypothetical protein ILFOPFJJ_03394 [Ensifer psoraleae]|nr:hypothetical protein [Sinorhizobium psoraleae]